MNTTTNYSLPQWEDTDAVKREDVNSAMAAIDEALAAAGGGNCKIVYGMYLGQNTDFVALNFDAKPVVIVACPRRKPSTVASQTLIAVRDAWWAPIVLPSSTVTVELTWLDRRIIWYGSNAESTLNANGSEYVYAALLVTDE